MKNRGRLENKTDAEIVDPVPSDSVLSVEKAQGGLALATTLYKCGETALKEYVVSGLLDEGTGYIYVANA